MSSSTPLNSQLQDAVAGHNAKSGVGALQHAAAARSGEQHLIERGYMPVRQITGKVVGVWGDAHIRHLDGTVTPLHVGDVVKKGEVVLTAQDGIVQLEASHANTQLATAGDDVERVIAQVGQGDADMAPAAGPNGGGAAGSLEEGLRVGRDAESVTPASLDLNPLAAPVQATQPQAAAPLATAPVANPDTESTGENTPVVFDPRGNDASASGLTVVAIAGHAIDPSTPVTLPQGVVTMNPDGTLTFTPNLGFSGSISFTYTDQNATGSTATSTVTVTVIDPPDHQPVAVADTFSGTEDTPIAGSLAGNDTPSADGGNVWSLATGAAHGSVTVNADGTFSYIPAAHYSGPDSFAYTITDVDGSTSTATVTLNVAPPAPVAVADVVDAHENAPVTGSLAANDTPVAGETNTWSVSGQPGHGTVTVAADGTYTYTPAPGFTGTDTFTYTITDASGQSSTASVTLTVTPIAPVAIDDSVTVTENAPATGSLAGNDSSVAGETNTWSVATAPAHGGLTVNGDGTYTYTPAPGYSGTDSFTYTVTDASGQASTATVTLTVSAQPVAAQPDAAVLIENTAVTGDLRGDVTQIAGDPNTFTVTTGPANGQLVLAADGSYTYTPATGYSGPDSFTYTVTDASGQTSTSTVTLSITPQPIAATPDAASVNENGSVSGTLAGDVTHVAGDPNTFTPGTASTPHGNVTIHADGSYDYTPTQGYSGPDSFSYTVTDRSGQSATATVSLAVVPLPIVAADDSNSGNENSTITGSLAADVTHVAGDPDRFVPGTTSTAHGSVTINVDGSYVYTPTTGYSGPDSFDYTVTNRSGAIATATVTLSVNPLGYSASPDSNHGPENSVISGSVANDVTQIAGDASHFAVGSVHPTHGSVVVNADGSYLYTPNTGFSGTDRFTYTATNASGQVASATVVITVDPLPISAKADTNAAIENGPAVSGSLAGDATTVAGDPNTFKLGTDASNGSVVVHADGTYTYTPNPGFAGTDTFSYVVTDQSSATATATVTITVAPLADAALPVSLSVAENGGTAHGSVVVAVPAGEFVTDIALHTQAVHGIAVVNADGTFTYTPDSGFAGSDTFSYTVTDTNGQTSTATVTVTVTPLADTANPASLTVAENSGAAHGTVVVAVPTGESVTDIALHTQAAHGVAVVNADGTYTYTPNPGFTGQDTFTYTVTDTNGQTSTATVTVTVNPLVDTANPGTLTIAENSGAAQGSVVVAVPAGETVTNIALQAQASNGSAVVHPDGTYTYTPNAGFAGQDTFSYTVTDSNGQTSTATVTVTVTPLADIANPASLTVAENSGTAHGTVVVAVPTGESVTDIALHTQAAHGIAVVNPDGTYSYTPNSGFAGQDTFSYTVTDTNGQTSTATVTVTVTPLVDTANPGTLTIAENSGAAHGTLSYAVPTGDAVKSITLTSQAGNGTAVVNADGTYAYTPNVGFAGHDTFSYTVADTNGQTSTATITVTVTPLADTADAATLSIAENSGTAHGTLSYAVPTGEAVQSITLATQAGNGTAVVNADGTYAYTPNPGFAGQDTFSYTVTDTNGQTSTATVTVTVNPLGDTANPATLTISENSGPAHGSVVVAVPAGESVANIALQTQAGHGTAVVNADGTYTYTPDSGFAGQDTFSYTVTDTNGQTSTATITVTVTPLADTANPGLLTIAENSGTAHGTLSIAVPTGEAVKSITLSSQAGNGTAVVNADGTYTYTPKSGYAGTDTFTYTVTDTNGQTSTATVTVTVTPLADTANAATLNITENSGTVQGTLSYSAPTGESITKIVLTTQAANGTAVVNPDGTYTYTPKSGYAGTDSFTYTVTDTNGQTSTATITVKVAPIADTANAATLNINENSGATQGTLSYAAPTGESITKVVLTTQAANGTAVVNADGTYTYTPKSGYAGTDTFTYTVTDTNGQTSTATITVKVAPLADTANAATLNVNENSGATQGTLSYSAPTGESITKIVLTGQATNGTAVVNPDGTYTYTPNVGFTGHDTFTYTVTDTNGQSSTATVTLTVAPINPTAAPDAFNVTANGPSSTLSVKTNDTPVAGETNNWSVKTNPTHGTITPAADFATTGNFTYTPTNGYTGADSFTYTITDASGLTSTATVSLTVVADVAPVAKPDTYAATENTLLVLNGAAGAANHALTTNDTDANGDALTVTQVNGATLDATHSVVVVTGGVTTGTVMMDANGVISFNPATNYTGNASFNYTISDGHGGTSTASVTISVAAGTDDPTVTANAVGRWLFNEGAGTSTADAYNSYTGTLTNVNTANGGTAPTWITGHNGTAGTALNFDGKGGIVSVPLADTAALNTTSSLSVWFKTTQVGSTIGWSSPSIIGTEHAGDANDIQWGSINSSGKIGLGLGNDPNGVYSATAVNDGNWHDLTITRTVNANGSSVVSVYIDGALSNSATLAAQSPATNGIPTNYLAGFGYTNAWQSTTTGGTTTNSDGTTGDVYYKGALDDARIYTHALTADQAKAVFLVENGYETQAVANDGDAIKLVVTDTHATALHVIGVENGMTLSDGTHTITSTGNSQVIDVTGWNLGSMQLTNVGTGSATLEFDAVNTTANGQSEDTSTYLSVVNGTSLLGGTTANDTLTATTNSATFISGGAGDDAITGSGGNDRLLGGTGNDTIVGGGGNDLIVGGTGSDMLTGGAGNDVFRWEFGDHGAAGTPSVDTITDFSSTPGNMDVLDLRDVLGGANHNGTAAGNIASFLHFDHSGADTIIHVSTTGGFSGGYSAAVEDETIVLKNVDLTAAGTQNDSQIIHQLLTNGQLHLG